jgi:hypothetical protein
MTISEQHLARLPKAVRDEINRLRTDVDDYRARWHAMSTGESEVGAITGDDDGAIVYLPPGSRIRFLADKAFATDPYAIEVHWDAQARAVEVHSYGAMRIEPRVTNSVFVRLVGPPRGD